MSEFDKSLKISGGQVRLAIGVADGRTDEIRDYTVVVQFPDGSAVVATVAQLTDVELPSEGVKRFDSDYSTQNRVNAVSHALVRVGYGPLAQDEDEDR